MTGRKEKFDPNQPGRVNMFVCGPTVYDQPHLGHARTYITYDIMARYLTLLGYNVHFVVNITDIDDKIYSKASQEKVEASIIAKRFTGEYLRAMSGLGINTVTSYEKASDHVADMIRQISTLQRKGYAYVGEGDVFYDTSKFDRYGKLSGQGPADLLLRRLELNAAKKNQSDFILWRRSGIDGPIWESPFGKGRPGWHIEDTAISIATFGPRYDIHGGAEELIYPHHEAEIAQAEAFTGMRPFVKYWIHTALLYVNGAKMSKSLGNMKTIRSIIKRYGAEAIRVYVASNHYRSRIEFREEDLAKALHMVSKIKEASYILQRGSKIRLDDSSEIVENPLRVLRRYTKSFYSAMDDDFATPRAIKMVLAFSEFVNTQAGALRSGQMNWASTTLSKMLSVIGVGANVLRPGPTDE